jgi:ankyrin repeat protein
MLFHAAESGDESLVALLLAKDASPSATARRWPDDGWTPLMIAAAAGNKAIVDKLLVAGAAVDTRNAKGRTALMFAAWYGRAPVVSALLAAGADPTIRDAGGLTPLVLAELYGDSESIRSLRSSIDASEQAQAGAQ